MLINLSNHTSAMWDESQKKAALIYGKLVDLPFPAIDPLAGTETLFAPSPGVVVFAVAPGQTLAAGDLVAEIIDPIEGSVARVVAGVDGLFFARIRDRYITTGGELGKIAGSQAFRTGELLGA